MYKLKLVYSPLYIKFLYFLNFNVSLKFYALISLTISDSSSVKSCIIILVTRTDNLNASNDEK